MLDSSALKFTHYSDTRTFSKPGFTSGSSGPLMLASDTTGKKYIVKYTYCHNAANEFTACWLADKIGAPAPKAYLLKPDSKKFPVLYGVAISYIDGLKPINKEYLTEQMKKDLCAQIVLNRLINNTDTTQLGESNGHIYSIDFSESFGVLNNFFLYSFVRNDESSISYVNNILDTFISTLSKTTFDANHIAQQYKLDPVQAKADISNIAKKILNITEDEIAALSDELSQMYPLGYARYYEKCIHAMKDRIQQLYG